MLLFMSEIPLTSINDMFVNAKIYLYVECVPVGSAYSITLTHCTRQNNSAYQ